LDNIEKSPQGGGKKKELLLMITEEVVRVRRLPVQLEPDPRRTIARFFWPGSERARRIISRVRQLPALRISVLLDAILEQFQPVNPGL
jgi:hypothetical protein